MSDLDSDWRVLVNKRLDTLENDLKKNTEATQENTETVVRVEKNTADVVAAFQAAAGAFKVLETLGKIGKPFFWLAGIPAMCLAAWNAIKHSWESVFTFWK